MSIRLLSSSSSSSMSSSAAATYSFSSSSRRGSAAAVKRLLSTGSTSTSSSTTGDVGSGRLAATAPPAAAAAAAAGGRFRMGWLKRYVRFRAEFYRNLLSSNDSKPLRPLSLFDFANDRDDMIDALALNNSNPARKDGWRTGDDGSIGGFSSCRAKFVVDAHGDDDDDERNGDTFVPFIRWYGTIDTTVGLGRGGKNDGRNVVRSGYAALRSPEFPFEGANLKGFYTHLELVCRGGGGDGGDGDGTTGIEGEVRGKTTTTTTRRRYTVNLMHSVPFTSTELYQTHVTIPPPPSSQQQQQRRRRQGDVSFPGFDRIVLPFRSFELPTPPSRQRRERVGGERSEGGGRFGDDDDERAGALDSKVCIESVGITLMDGLDGEFQFDLARIRAVNIHDGAVYEG